MIELSVLTSTGDGIAASYSYSAVLSDHGTLFVQVESVYSDATAASCTIGGVAANTVKIGNDHTQQILFWRDNLPAGNYAVSVTGLAGKHYSNFAVYFLKNAKTCTAKTGSYDHAASAETHSSSMTYGRLLVEVWADFSTTDLALNSGQTSLAIRSVNEGSMKVGFAYKRDVGAGSVSTTVTWHSADNSYYSFEFIPFGGGQVIIWSS